ncbi:MAG: LexA family protein, partial [Polyangia bacterium]
MVVVAVGGSFVTASCAGTIATGTTPSAAQYAAIADDACVGVPAKEREMGLLAYRDGIVNVTPLQEDTFAGKIKATRTEGAVIALRAMVELTPAQKRVLDFIQAEIRADRPIPTLREIAARFGFRGHRAAACHLDALKRKGFVESEPGKARSLRVTSPLAKLRSRIADIPLFGSIPAGFSSDREQQPD